MTKQRGTFIVCEGGEGAGKSTCIQRLKEILPEDKFLFTREPGGSPNAEQIRDIVVNNNYNALEQLLLMETGRSLHMYDVVRPTLESGRNVICDRFSGSTFAYQIVAGDDSLESLFKELENAIVGDYAPDVWIDFVLDPATGVERKKDSGERLNVFDTKEFIFHQKVREGLDIYLKDKNTERIDASLSKEDVVAQAMAVIEQYC